MGTRRKTYITGLCTLGSSLTLPFTLLIGGAYAIFELIPTRGVHAVRIHG